MSRKRTKLIHQGRMRQDATKLDVVRKALRQGDIATAAKHGRVFVLVPVPPAKPS
jgi:hypothetical protein